VARRPPSLLLLLLLALCAPVCASAAAAALAPAPACGYLRQAVQSLPGDAVLLASYPSEHGGPLGEAAFTYDEALAAMALIACGHSGQARRIGNALLLALEHDRYWHDGRLRNAYRAGTLRDAAPALVGWWDPALQRWLEDGYQAGSDGGNVAWAMLALLDLAAATADQRYRDGALRLARWTERLLDVSAPGGYRGGYQGHEPDPLPLSWKSTEHNTDLAAAFQALAQDGGDVHWQQRAAEAAAFVERMWRDDCGCFAAGTGADGVTVNRLLALDAQVWPLLAVPGMAARRAAVLSLIERRLRTAGGYTYGEAGGGAWSEGTAQVALLLRLLHRDAAAASLLALLEQQRTPDGGYYASASTTPTGFMLATDTSVARQYFHREHLAAAAWAALAQQGYNPFVRGRRLPP